MAVHELARDAWHPFFEDLTRIVRGRQTGVEIASADLGDQKLVENLPLLGISFDTRGDRLEIEFESIGHRIAGPFAVFVDQAADGVIGIEVEAAGGERTILRLKEPLLLPEPATGA